MKEAVDKILEAEEQARKLVEEVGMEIEERAKALGEKLAALEDEIRAQCEPVGPGWGLRLRPRWGLLPPIAMSAFPLIPRQSPKRGVESPTPSARSGWTSCRVRHRSGSTPVFVQMRSPSERTLRMLLTISSSARHS